jgi:hypothetical protein
MKIRVFAGHVLYASRRLLVIRNFRLHCWMTASSMCSSVDPEVQRRVGKPACRVQKNRFQLLLFSRSELRRSILTFRVTPTAAGCGSGTS